MQENVEPKEVAEAARKAKWDEFLDAYSMYLGDPTLANAASLRLAGAALEETDETFSLESFLARLGWQEEVGCQS
jgi:hypothetical protein